MKTISITSTCYNEEQNLWELYDRTTAVMVKFPQFQFEYILSDNGSTDHTADVLRAIAEKDKRFKIIINNRNYGLWRSNYNTFRQATGDCVISIFSDLQDPPELIETFIRKWEEGHKVVIGVKNKSKENGLMFRMRKLYYRLLRSISEVEQIENFTGFGLYDRSVADILCRDEWPPPYMRGLVSEIGFPIEKVYYTQQRRKAGTSSFNFLRLFDTAMIGVTSYSKMPLRLATILGGFLSLLGLLFALLYLILKLCMWDTFPAGTAPMVLGLFFFSSVQIFMIGIVGEYVMQVLEHVRKKPLVIAQEAIGFDDNEGS